MKFQTVVPTQNGPVTIPAALGEVTFLLGPNGAGKSALMHLLFVRNFGVCRRITAHRQNWLQSNAVEMAPSQLKQQKDTTQQQDTMQNARYIEYQSQQRPGFIVFDLLSAENFRARQIASLVTEKNMDGAEKRSLDLGPLQEISELMARSNMPIEIYADETDSLMASKNGGTSYSISALSDGERNALLIGASVLLAEPDSLILIDEPERHLHRSIMTPFLNQLFSRRPDCAFIVSTHDLELPSNYVRSPCVLVRECAFTGENIDWWKVNIVNAIEDIDIDFRIDILGSRQKIVFIEGESGSSLDVPLYSEILPGVSVQSKGNCKEVISHVKGIRGSQDLHWVEAFGVVDRDQMSDSEVAALKISGIYAISCYSVESIYYNEKIQSLVAEALCKITGKNPAVLVGEAKSASINTIGAEDIKRLSARMVERLVRNQLLEAAPSWKKLDENAMIGVSINIPALLAKEVKKLQELIVQNDLNAIIQRYPIRETKIIATIVNRLDFKNRGQYEASVLTLIRENNEAKRLVESLLGGLATAVKE